MQNLQNELIALLEREDSLVVEGQLNKNKIVEMALQVDVKLIQLLLSSDSFKKHFFKDVSGVMVFDKIKFQRFVNNKSFLPDSYTAFKNKIGLTIDDGSVDHFVSEKNDVVLSWAHKDCVLEGGQTKEEQKRDEVFWNETLAPDEIDRLLDAKAFTNFKKYDKDGEHELSDISIDDNLILKGNNLLCLSSLLKTHRGKIKLIYIDPPYNTGSDSFGYNDNFNHSTWLTFMKNRLEIARKLLTNDGSIYIHIDHHQLGYLNVLMDSIFGKENKVQVISVKTASPAGFKTVNPGPIDVTEYILFYTKNKNSYKFKKGFVPTGYNRNYNLYLERKENISEWIFVPIKAKVIESLGFKNEKEAKKQYGALWTSIYKVLLGDFAYQNADKIVSVRDPHKPSQKLKDLMLQSKEKECVVEYVREDGSSMYLYKGGALAFYSNKIQRISGKNVVTELLTDFWNHISWAGIAKEGGVKLKNGKKPEKLIKQIFDLSTEPGDLVLDFHLGCGTTAAVAHKMNRKYIGIEQLNYNENDCTVRLQNVIAGDSTGVSDACLWKGGGSFVYAELMQYNQEFVDKISNSLTKEELIAIWEEMQEKAFLSYRFDKKKFNERIEAFKTAPIELMKQFLFDVLDKNQLYVNYSEIDDSIHDVSEEDKKLNKKFYKLNN